MACEGWPETKRLLSLWRLLLGGMWSSCSSKAVLIVVTSVYPGGRWWLCKFREISLPAVTVGTGLQNVFYQVRKWKIWGGEVLS